jgi:hypothetical protein
MWIIQSKRQNFVPFRCSEKSQPLSVPKPIGLCHRSITWIIYIPWSWNLFIEFDVAQSNGGRRPTFSAAGWSIRCFDHPSWLEITRTSKIDSHYHNYCRNIIL